MITNDYLMRLIERFANAFMNMMVGKADVPPEERAQQIENLLAEGLNANPLFLFSHLDAVLEECEPRISFQVARLLDLHAEALANSNKDPARSARYAAAFAAIFLANPIENSEIETAQNIVRRAYDSAELDLEHLDLLFVIEEQAGHFAKAEDVLFDALERDHDPARHERGLAFFERLQKIDPALLEKGGLTPHEVEESLLHLEELVP